MKHIAGVAIRNLFFTGLFVCVALIGVGFAPTEVNAQEISAQTQQLLPPGQNTCPQVTATGFTPYIYDGALHSFEFTVPDASYVAVIGTVGNQSIPFQLMTRRVQMTGALRIHVDVNTTPITGTLPIQLTLLSAKSGQPVCATLVSIKLGSGPVQNTPAAPSYPSTPTPSTPSYPTPGQGNTGSSGNTPGSNTGNPATTPGNSQGGAATSGTSSSVVGGMHNPLRGICSTDIGAYRLWLVLLVLYALIVGAALWAEFPASWTWMRTPERVAALILVLLLALLAFWYFAPACRTEFWIPLLAVLVAILGLIAAFRNHPTITRFFIIEEVK